MRYAQVNLGLLACVAAGLSAGALAQTPKVAKAKPGDITGVVLNAKGAPVAGAQVLWQVADGETPHILHSDEQGHFHVGPLRTGLYEVRASADGAWTSWQHNILVPPGGEANVTLRLALTPPPAAAMVELKGAMRTWDVPVAGAMPHDPAVDPMGNVWFTLQDAGQIARFNPDTQEWKIFKIPTPDSGPDGLVSDTFGNIWFTEKSVGKIGRWDIKTEAIVEYPLPSAKDPNTPALGPDRTLWFSAQQSNVIGRLDIRSGQITEYGVPTQDANPYGMVLANDGGLWFCELRGGKLGRVEPKTAVITEFSPQDSHMQPRRLIAVNGAIYFTDSGTGRLGRLTLDDKTFKFWASPSGADSQPYAIAADTTGEIWYVETAEKANMLIRFIPALEMFATYPMPAPNASVRSIVRDAHGHLWMPLSAPNKIMLVE